MRIQIDKLWQWVVGKLAALRVWPFEGGPRPRPPKQ